MLFSLFLGLFCRNLFFESQESIRLLERVTGRVILLEMFRKESMFRGTNSVTLFRSHYDPRQVHILTVRESSWLTDQTYQYDDVVRCAIYYLQWGKIKLFKGDVVNFGSELQYGTEVEFFRSQFLFKELVKITVFFSSYLCMT